MTPGCVVHLISPDATADVACEQIAMGASINDYGARASRDLIVTRGAGFRKAKDKKKKGVSFLCLR